ncbi:TspO/MBR family protein [Paenibacillus sp. YYML68]|uniref:TspO/MBR family protein n=1 Tax=Paenibacillus sp. YYML68 TaxID=2909250 RepID=UPI0024911787|nr:TspO/MBR family protein [Paenibacillus sp. YYML68]
MKVHTWLNAIGLALVLIVNALANTIPLGGRTTGEISAMFPVQITPAPYTFSIWIVIYCLLIAFVIVQFLQIGRSSAEVQSLGPWFWISCIFNAGWIVIWHELRITASLFVMLGLLLTLIAAYVRVRPNGWSSSPVIRFLVQLPFSVYLGWISVATIINVTVVLYQAGWDGFGLSGDTWTILLILLAVVLNVVIGAVFRDWGFTATGAWALTGVGVANIGTNSIMYIAWGSAALLAMMSIVLVLRGRRGE